MSNYTPKINNELKTMKNVTIEIIGEFIWVYGETDQYKDLLRKHKFIKRTHNPDIEMPNAWYIPAPNWKPNKKWASHHRDIMVDIYGSFEKITL